MALSAPSPLDRATLVYVAVALAFTLARWPRALARAELLPVGLVLLALVAGVLAPRARRTGGVGRLLGEFYPLVVTLALYTHVGLVNAARGVSHDAVVQGWEQALFGGQPSLAWIRAQPWPALSAVLHAAYLSFFPILIAAPGALWLTGRPEAARRTLLLVMTTFYVSYAAFMVFPVAGPRYLFPLPANAATAGPLVGFAHRLVAGGSAWGTAFPSSHVAVTLVAAACAWREWRPLGVVLLPVSLLLALGTVYGQFHYGVDALAGGALGAGVLAVGGWRPSPPGPGGRGL
jgi:membrane-associated phospholipid phosphatase